MIHGLFSRRLFISTRAIPVPITITEITITDSVVDINDVMIDYTRHNWQLVPHSQCGNVQVISSQGIGDREF